VPQTESYVCETEESSALRRKEVCHDSRNG
jgi:hypothetical protein